MSLQSSGQALARFLADPARGGVYRLEAARADALGPTQELDWCPLPTPSRWTREGLLDALAVSLAFPAHFGRNWDAAWDCLTELAWEPGQARVLLVPTAPADATAMVTFVELMNDAGAHWASRGQTLATLVVWQGPPPVWLEGVPRLPEAATAMPP